jgi:hypothetical protein
LTFCPPKKELKKNFFEIGRTGYQKKRNFTLISKMCRSLAFGKKGNKFYRKTEFLGTWKILQKIVFLRTNLWELLDARVLRILKSAQNFASFDTLCTQFRRNFFSTFIRDGAVFLEVKRSNKI